VTIPAQETMKTSLSHALIAALLPACASTSPAHAFRDTAQLVEARSGRRIVWNQGGPDDQAVARHVRDLLRRDLSVDDAVQIALLDNQELQALYEDLSVAQADLVQAGLLKNPTLSGSLTIPIAGDVQTGFELGIVQDFLSLLLLPLRKKVASAELEATKLRVGSAVLHEAFAVQAAYYTFVAAEQVRDMRRAALEVGDANLALAEGQHGAGSISDLDLVSQRTQVEQLRLDIRRSEADVVGAREELTRQLGLWGPDTDFHTPTRLPDPSTADPPLDHLEQLAIARRLDLASAHQQTLAASEAASLARTSRFLLAPSVGFSVERSPEHYSAETPSASVELPIFDQHQAEVARLEGQARQAFAREAALAVDIRSEVRAAHARLAAMRDVVDRYTAVVVPLREQVVMLSQEQYSAMLLGAPMLLLAKQNALTAQRELIEALRDYWIARADLERAVGAAFPAAPPAPAQGTPHNDR
jgi:cobalt-zinc-cadmium efflux system outer membrane protein